VGGGGRVGGVGACDSVGTVVGEGVGRVGEVVGELVGLLGKSSLYISTVSTEYFSKVPENVPPAKYKFENLSEANPILYLATDK
jgi:hypothetical protein